MMTSYHYTESGLPNVFIEGLSFPVDDDGDEVIQIPFISALHAEIVRGIIMHKGAMQPEQIRFVRTELGMSQARLGEILGVKGLTVGRWERGEIPMANGSETLLRKLASEQVLKVFDTKIEDLAKNVASAANQDESITIHAQGEGYSLAA